MQRLALLACFFVGIAVCACDDRRVVTDIDVAVSVTGADGTLLDAESSPEGEVVLRTRNECVDGHLNLCLCDDGGYALVRLNYTGNGRFTAFDLATSEDSPPTSTGLIVQGEFQSITSAYSHGELYRFGDENDFENNDLVILDETVVREDDVVTVSYALDEGPTVTERHTIHRPGFLLTEAPADPFACVGDCSSVGQNGSTFIALLAFLALTRARSRSSKTSPARSASRRCAARRPP